MRGRALVLGSCKFCLSLFLLTFVATLLPSHAVHAQGLELGGGWVHNTGDFGTDGFDLDAAWWFNRRVTLAANYDSGWDTSTLSNFAFTEVGAIAIKSHLQSFLAGPRIFFSSDWTSKHKLQPFGEAQFGFSNLNQEVTQVNAPTVSKSDTAFSWMLGGGAEYLFTPHWSGRANLDFLRTHFANQGQSHLRLVLGITYTFGSREAKEKTTSGTGPRD
jgi:opacity protein-like surface antigen